MYYYNKFTKESTWKRPFKKKKEKSEKSAAEVVIRPEPLAGLLTGWQVQPSKPEDKTRANESLDKLEQGSEQWQARATHRHYSLTIGLRPRCMIRCPRLLPRGNGAWGSGMRQEHIAKMRERDLMTSGGQPQSSTQLF